MVHFGHLAHAREHAGPRCKLYISVSSATLFDAFLARAHTNQRCRDINLYIAVHHFDGLEASPRFVLAVLHALASVGFGRCLISH